MNARDIKDEMVVCWTDLCVEPIRSAGRIFARSTLDKLDTIVREMECALCAEHSHSSEEEKKAA